MPSEAQIEAAARAIMIARDNGGCEVVDWAGEALRNPHVAQALRQARAALSAAEQHADDGVAAIAAERERQKTVEGWTPEHDDKHTAGEMARAAGLYALIAGADPTNFRNAKDRAGMGDVYQEVMNLLWPWHPRWFKSTTRRRNLVKAGALIAAEIDRLDRAADPLPAPPRDLITKGDRNVG